MPYSHYIPLIKESQFIPCGTDCEKIRSAFLKLRVKLLCLSWSCKCHCGAFTGELSQCFQKKVNKTTPRLRLPPLQHFHLPVQRGFETRAPAPTAHLVIHLIWRHVTKESSCCIFMIVFSTKKKKKAWLVSTSKLNWTHGEIMSYLLCPWQALSVGEATFHCAPCSFLLKRRVLHYSG